MMLARFGSVLCGTWQASLPNYSVEEEEMDMSFRLILVLGLTLALAVSLAPCALGQATVSYAQLNGTVLDTTGRAVVKAAITVRNPATNQTYAATSNEAGFYIVPNLPPGVYDVTVEFHGFSKFTQTGIALTVGQTATINVNLKVAAAGEIVVVTGEAPPVEPTRTEVSQVIDARQIQELPTNGRQFVDFALLTPGVATGRTSLQSTFTEPETTRISFGGMRDLSNAVTVDGADYINEATGSQRATPSQEAVEEFRVVNNSFGAEYGRALGGIVNVVTKSGTNNLHGSLYGYLSNKALNSKSLLQTSQYDQYRRGQLGATLGGPIRKDKTFFFMNYESQRRGESPTYPATLTSPDNLTAINAAKAALGLPGEDLNILKTLDNDNGFARLDHQFSTNNHLSIHYGIVDARDLNVLVGDTLDGGGIGAPSDGHNTFLRDQSLVGTLNSTLKPDLVNTFLVQYARRHYTFPATTGQPNLDVPNTLSFGHNFGTFDAMNESRQQISDSLAWVKGNHYWRFGVDSNFVENFVIWPGFTPMRIITPNINCLVDFANFVNDTAGVASVPADGPCPTAEITPATNFGFPPSPFGANPYDPLNGVPIVFWGAPVGTGPITQGSLPPAIPTDWANAYLDPQDYYVNLHHRYFGAFVQDQWRLTPKLTLNYGLRWDVEGGLSQIINPDYRGFQPRVGLAYSPTKHTVIRTGYGIFDDHYNMTFFFVTYPQREVVIPNSPQPWVRKGNSTATWVLNQLSFDPPNPANGFQPLPYPDGSTVPTPAQAAATMILTGQAPPNFSTGPGPGQDPNFPAGTFVTNSGGGFDRNLRTAYSEQASLQIDQEIGKGLVVSAGYLFLRAHKQVRPENLNVCPSAGLANSATDCPPASAVPGPPITPDGPFPDNKLPDGRDAFSGVLYNNAGLMYYLDGSGNAEYDGGTLSVSDRFGQFFRFNANYTWSHTRDDGTFTTFVSTPEDLYNRALERADSVQDVRNRFVGNFTADAPSHGFLRNFELSSIINLESPRPFTMFVGNDINGDTNPVTDRVGLSPRNAYRGDHLYSVDMRVARAIHFSERTRLDLAFDAFNVFNRQNINEVTSVYGGGTIDFCGAEPQHFGDAASLAIQQGTVSCPAASNGGAPAPNPLFGTPRTMFNPRQLQISAKFSF
ncbi:MAG TPA: TonB-dependent receptor [Terriglobales bacterium]|nr:TonB-dependent receptor [Terriglobales bacterium]